MTRFATPRGTEDILPEDWPYWNLVQGHAEDVAHLFGYRRIETPTFAETILFRRTVGEGSDIVDHEMYTFQDRGGDDLTLRPEGTAPVMRAYLQHGMDKLPQPVRLFYMERNFRYERPQRGRTREHHQFGCEAIGSDDAYLDVEMIDLLRDLFQRLRLTDLSLHVNSIGDKNCRPAYVETLRTYLTEHESELDAKDRQRLERSPLRVLDSKEARSQLVIDGSPHILDNLCAECQEHWDRLLHGFQLLGIEYIIDHRLVRGLDYYTRTVFEFFPPEGGSQSAVAAGGRYDGLSEAIGGPPVPGVGFGAGMDRLVLNVEQTGSLVPLVPSPAVFIAHLGGDTEDVALRLAAMCHAANIATEMAAGDRSLRAQMRQADHLGAQYAAIAGEDEAAAGEVTLRSLKTGDQRRVPIEEVPRILLDEGARSS